LYSLFKKRLGFLFYHDWYSSFPRDEKGWIFFKI